MGSVKTFFHLLKNDRSKIRTAVFRRLSGIGVLKILSDRAFLKYAYRAHFGKKLNLKNPVTFNEKLNWLKLYNRNPEYRKLVDKYEVKNYIAEKIGEEYVIPTIGVWDKVSDIDFDALPDSFVLKCTHDSGSAVICKGKSSFDFEKAKKKLNKKIRKNFYWYGREWPYKDLKPRIIAEEYITDRTDGTERAEGDDLHDYKLFCFNGECKFFKIDFDRFTHHRANYYDKNKQLMPMYGGTFLPDHSRDIYIPSSMDKMIELAERLSTGFPHVRVDFYDVGDKIYFGELTFFHCSGLEPFYPEEWDKTLGDWLILPEKR